MMAWGQKIQHPWATSWEESSPANQRPGMGALTNKRESCGSLTKLVSTSERVKTDFYDTDRQLLPSSAQFHSLCNFFPGQRTFVTWSFVSDLGMFVLIWQTFKVLSVTNPFIRAVSGHFRWQWPSHQLISSTQDEQIILSSESNLVVVGLIIR